MAGAGEAIAALTDSFLRLGVSNFVLIFALGLLGWAFIRGRVSGTTTKEAVAEATAPVGCMWADIDRQDLQEAIRRLEKIEQDLAVLKDRQR